MNIKATARRISLWARDGGVQTNVCHQGRFRTVVDHCCIAIQWMSKGGPYDDRTLRQRLVAGNFYWKAAARAIVR
jgi:hypothetical protein